MRARPVARHPTSLVRNMAPRTNSGSAAGGSSGDGKEAGETVFTNPMLGASLTHQLSSDRVYYCDREFCVDGDCDC